MSATIRWAIPASSGFPVPHHYRVAASVVKADIAAEVADEFVHILISTCRFFASSTLIEVVSPWIALVFATAAFQSPTARTPSGGIRR